MKIKIKPKIIKNNYNKNLIKKNCQKNKSNYKNKNINKMKIQIKIKPKQN